MTLILGRYANGSIPTTILKHCVDIYLHFLTNTINKTSLGNYYPKELEKGNIEGIYREYREYIPI